MTPSPIVRQRAALCCLAVIALFITACSDLDATGDASAGDDAEAAAPSWLFTQTAEGGRFEVTDGRVTRLVMTDVDLHTIAFSDRPDRLTEVAGTEGMTDAWDEMFGDDPPNAVLVEHSPAGETDSVVVVLRRPVFDASARTLTYDVEVLADEQHPESVEGLAGEVHEVPPTEFRAVSLFIDDTTCAPPGVITTCLIPPPPPLTPPPPPTPPTAPPPTPPRMP